MDPYEIVRWSAWPSLVCYTLALGLWVGPRANDWKSTARQLWSGGWFLLLIHVVIAFGTVHHWSLSEAYKHTAKQTFAAVGWNWGGGVYWNFVTLGIWGWTVLAARNEERSNPIIRLEHIAQWYLAFMMFNATVVFGSRPAQIAGMVICIGLAWRYLTPELPR